MHEVSLGGTIRDYLSGEAIPDTTFEDFRQALARLLVEEKGYPRGRLTSKVGVSFPVGGETYCRVIDLVAYGEDGGPLLLVLFCAGKPATYERETLAAARLIHGGPAPLALVTDTREAILLDVAGGNVLAEGMAAVPRWEDLQRLAAGRPRPELTPARLDRERRILYAYSEMLTSCCEGTCCPLPKAGV